MSLALTEGTRARSDRRDRNENGFHPL